MPSSAPRTIPQLTICLVKIAQDARSQHEQAERCQDETPPTRCDGPVRPTVGFGVFGSDGTGPCQTGDGPSSRTLDDLTAERCERRGTTQLLSAGQSRCVERGRDLLHQAGSVVEVCWRQ
jgi:hypothetical protein